MQQKFVEKRVHFMPCCACGEAYKKTIWPFKTIFPKKSSIMIAIKGEIHQRLNFVLFVFREQFVNENFICREDCDSTVLRRLIIKIL